MNICSICLEDIEIDSCILTCKHKFHTECIKQLIKLDCPLCRQKIDVNKVFNRNYKICLGNHHALGTIFGYAPIVPGGYCRFCYGLPL